MLFHKLTMGEPMPAGKCTAYPHPHTSAVEWSPFQIHLCHPSTESQTQTHLHYIFYWVIMKLQFIVYEKYLLYSNKAWVQKNNVSLRYFMHNMCLSQSSSWLIPESFKRKKVSYEDECTTNRAQLTE